MGEAPLLRHQPARESVALASGDQRLMQPGQQSIHLLFQFPGGIDDNHAGGSHAAPIAIGTDRQLNLQNSPNAASLQRRQRALKLLAQHNRIP